MALYFKRDFTDETLEQAPMEAAQLLSATAAVPEIGEIMAQAGMTAVVVAEGKSLLLAALGAPGAPVVTADTPKARAAREASAEINNWDEHNLPVYAAAIGRQFPSAAEYVFGDLTTSDVASEAVHTVATMLARVQHLEAGTDPNRTATAADDKRAVVLLSERGLTKAERDRLQKLVDVAFGDTGGVPPPPPAAPATDPGARRAALLALKLWVNEWSTVAHARIKKRSWLIRMGLAKRKSPKREQ